MWVTFLGQVGSYNKITRHAALKITIRKDHKGHKVDRFMRFFCLRGLCDLSVLCEAIWATRRLEQITFQVCNLQATVQQSHPDTLNCFI
jgi:hypothetical protein